MNTTYDLSWYEELGAGSAEDVKLDIAYALERAMDDAGLSKAALAKLANVSAARITRVLRGDANLTVESICQLVDITGHKVHLHLARKDAKVRWFESHACFAQTMQTMNVASEYAHHSTSVSSSTQFDEQIALAL